jgi:hypothetical protein
MVLGTSGDLPESGKHIDQASCSVFSKPTGMAKTPAMITSLM